jgi:indole-3-glycerol phosphate synthase
MDVLERVLRIKRADLDVEKAQLPMRRAIEMASAAPPPQDFAAALREAGPVGIIAEVRRADPDRGGAGLHDEPDQAARACEAGGAAAISVLTDGRFLAGAPEHLQAVRHAVRLPLLRKDFIFDEYQVYTSRALGADSLLLIARILDARVLQSLIGVARSLHMEALVEVRDAADVDRAVSCGATLIGVNNRDASSRTVSLDNALALADRLPRDATRVSESGIETPGDLRRLAEAGYHAALIGETLMKSPDPGLALRALRGVPIG